MNRSSFADLLRVDRYGDFLLPPAIRLGRGLSVIPREGYRLDCFRDSSGREIPMLAASVTSEKLFDLFLSLTEPLGEIVDVVLETSHDMDGANHRDLVRERIERPILLSYFCEFESLLMNDGCTGVAVISRVEPMEIQFDEHKIIIIYANNLEPFIKLLYEADIHPVSGLSLIPEGEHMHRSAPHYRREFAQLSTLIGVVIA